MLFAKIKNKLKVLLNDFDSFIDSHLNIALQITTELKNILSAPPSDILSAIIPASITPALRQEIITAIDQTITTLNLAETCKQYIDLNEKLNCFIQQVQKMDPDLQEAVLQKITSLVTGILHGNSLKQYLYDLYAQIKTSAQKVAVK
jgi:hypothetical protein